MKHVKIACLILLSALMVSALGQFSAVHSDSALREKALAYVQNVLPLDMASYTVSYGDDYALPQGPGDEVLTEAASVYLTSGETTLLAHFMFRNGLLHECALSPMTGGQYLTKDLVIDAREYVNMADVAGDVLAKYQAFTDIDSTVLISLLGQVDETKRSSAASGDVNLTVSTSSVPTHVTFSSGHMEPIGNETVNSTFFHWTYSHNGAAYMHVAMTFQNGVFSRFTDDRAVYTIGSTEVSVTQKQAVDTAKNYLGSHTFVLPNGTHPVFDMAQAQTQATLASYPRNGTILCPFWGVNLDFDNTPADDVSIYVWADTGEIFWCYLGGAPLKIDEAYSATEGTAEPTATPAATPTATPTPTGTPSPSPTAAPTQNPSAPHANNSYIDVHSQAQQAEPTADGENAGQSSDNPADPYLMGIAAGFAVAICCIAAVVLIRRRRENVEY